MITAMVALFIGMTRRRFLGGPLGELLQVIAATCSVQVGSV